MKANELRIGNWYNEFGISKKATAGFIQKFAHIESINKTAIDVSPIPLTPEILEKAGFVKGLSSAIHRRQDYQMERFGIICICNSENQFFVNGRLVVLKYVHQLQNLYFALTGEELNIEL
jgi:hypothetical protein